MAGPWYVSSVNGNDANSGLSKALAKASIKGASGLLSTAIAAGETVRIDKAHVENVGTGHLLVAWPGTMLLPNIIISIDWTTDTYAFATQKQFYNTGSGDHVLEGSTIAYGAWWGAGDDFDITYSPHRNVFYDSKLELIGAGSQVIVGTSNLMHVLEMYDVEIDFTNTGSSTVGCFYLVGEGRIVWRNGPNNRSKVTWAKAVQPDTVVYTTTSVQDAVIQFEGVDLSAITSSLFDWSDAQAYHNGEARNCIVGAGISLVQSTVGNPNSFAKMIGCDDTTGNDKSRAECADYYGSTVTDDANYRDDGASDGTENHSWKMVSNANAVEFHSPTVSPWVTGWVASTAEQTFLLETNSENVTFQDDELWIEFEYMDAAGNPQVTISSSAMADIDATPANVPNSVDAPTWTTPGITTEKKQQLAVTLTPGRIGPVRLRVFLAKPSATVWICPLVKAS